MANKICNCATTFSINGGQLTIMCSSYAKAGGKAGTGKVFMQLGCSVCGTSVLGILAKNPQIVNVVYFVATLGQGWLWPKATVRAAIHAHGVATYGVGSRYMATTGLALLPQHVCKATQLQAV